MIHCGECHSIIFHNGNAICDRCLRRIKDEKKRLEYELTEVKREKENKISNLQQEISDLRNHVSELQISNDNLKMEIKNED